MADREEVLAALAELFRQRGFAATSLPDITAATGLGKGSLYHLFPGGKQQMLNTVVEDVTTWFHHHIFTPLKQPNPDIEAMFTAVNEYFDAGRRLCLIGRVGLEPDLTDLDQTLSDYFTAWITALQKALEHHGLTPRIAKALAEDTVSNIQGALVVAHTQREPALFTRSLNRMRQHLKEALAATPTTT